MPTGGADSQALLDVMNDMEIGEGLTNLFQRLIDFIFPTDPIAALPWEIWNYALKMAISLLTLQPMEYSNETWGYVANILYPWFSSAASVLINMFFLMGFIRQTSDLKNDITMEMWVELMIKVIIANALILDGMALAGDFFSFTKLASTSLVVDLPNIDGVTVSNDLLGKMATTSIALICTIGAAFCAIKLLTEVFIRFVNLYFLVGTAPIALSTLAGGRGFEDTAFAWIRTFLTEVFRGLVMIIVIILSAYLTYQSTGAIATMAGMSVLSEDIAGILIRMTMMFVTATLVARSDDLLKRAFNLR